MFDVQLLSSLRPLPPVLRPPAPLFPARQFNSEHRAASVACRTLCSRHERAAPPNFAGVISGSRSRLFWRLQIGGWLLLVPFSIVYATVAFSDLPTIFFTGFVRQAIGFGLTLLMQRLYRRWVGTNFKLASHAWKIALVSLAATVIDIVLIELLRYGLHLPPAPIVVQPGTLGLRFGIYAAWSSFYFGIRQELDSRERELRLARAETAAREAELTTLRAQINPHFLFNALTSILAECDDNPRAVRAITRSLADYLRFSLLQQNHHAPLGAEVDAIAAYLRVEQARFEEKLVHTFVIEDVARDALVPTAVLLPLVENAVKYGMRTSPRPLRIAVAATLRDGRVTLVVENSGHWVESRPGTADSTQIGLANLRRRLALLHGDDAALAVQHDPQQVRVTVTLPAFENPPEKIEHA